MQISQGKKSPRQEDKNTHPQKYCLLQRRQQDPPLVGFNTQPRQQSLHHVCHAEKWAQARHHHPVENRQQCPLPSNPVGCNPQMDKQIQKRIANNTSICCLVEQPNIPHHKQDHQACSAGCSSGDGGNETLHKTHEIRTHSIQSRAAMAMYLGGVPLSLQSWWSGNGEAMHLWNTSENRLKNSLSMCCQKCWWCNTSARLQTQQTVWVKRLNMADWPAWCWRIVEGGEGIILANGSWGRGFQTIY